MHESSNEILTPQQQERVLGVHPPFLTPPGVFIRILLRIIASVFVFMTVIGLSANIAGGIILGSILWLVWGAMLYMAKELASPPSSSSKGVSINPDYLVYADKKAELLLKLKDPAYAAQLLKHQEDDTLGREYK